MMWLIGMKLKVPVADFVAKARAQNLLLVAAGDNTVRVLPRLTVSDDEIRDGLSRLDHAAAAFASQPATVT